MDYHKLYLSLLLATGLAGFWQQSLAQTVAIPLDEAVSQSLQKNGLVQSVQYTIQAQQSLKGTASDIGKFSIAGMFGQYNSYIKSDNNITITQSIPFPTVFGARAALRNAQVKSSELRLAATKNELAFQVKSTWYQLVYLHALQAWLIRQDSLLKEFSRAAEIRHRTGETNLLEKVTAESKHLHATTLLVENEADIAMYKKRLQTLMNSDVEVDAAATELKPRSAPFHDSVTVFNNPALALYRSEITVSEREKRLEKNAMAPDLTLGYFNQTLIGTPIGENTSDMATQSDRFQGFQIGVSIPLWFGPQASRIKSAEYNRLSVQKRYEQEQRNYKDEVVALSQKVIKLNNSLSYYSESALPHAELIMKQADLAFRNGEIGYMEFIQALNTAADLRAGYLSTLNSYNQAVVNLEYLLGYY